MAHYKRGRPRTVPPHHARGGGKYDVHPERRWMRCWPRWHDIVFHTRPRRRRTREAVILVMQGRDPDAILWPVEKKPHVYYW